MAYDAVVVGSGPNGLAAAITLAERGRSVLVLEAQDRLGGGLATEELTLPGFRHDVFSAVHPAAAASPVFARWPLERHGLRWVQPEIAMAHPLPGGRAVGLARGLGETAASLDALAPGDGASWAAFMEPYLRRFAALRGTMLAGFPPVSGPVRLLAGLGVTGTLELARRLLQSASALAGELFAAPGSAAWLYGSALHNDVPPDGAGSAIGAFYLHLLGHAVGWPSPQGGAGRLADALLGHLASLGGRARTGARVERVLVRGGRAAGVLVAGQGEVLARIVVCDITPHALVALAGDALPDGYVRRLVRFRYGPQTLKVDWALDGPIPWEAPDARRAGTVHVGGEADEIMTAVGALRDGRLPEHPFLLAGQQSIADPTRAPAGRHTAWAYTRVPRGIDWGTEREQVIERDRAVERERAVEHDMAVERVEAQIERFAPGFRDRILARHVMTPPDLQARDANLVGGDVGGGSYALDQLVFRPIPALSPYRTPVRGLYLASASTFPGGGVHGVPGHAAARQALLDDRMAKVRRISAGATRHRPP